MRASIFYFFDLSSPQKYPLAWLSNSNVKRADTVYTPLRLLAFSSQQIRDRPKDCLLFILFTCDIKCLTSPYSSSIDKTERKASWGTSTEPIDFIRFLPAFCFSKSLRFRETSPP